MERLIHQIILLLVIGNIVLQGNVALSAESSEQALSINGAYVAEAKSLKPFELIQGSGESFVNADLKGKWSFIYFGYTACPDACPMTMLYFNQIDKRLAQQNSLQDTAYWLISLDPRRDSPELLAQYTRHFNPKFRGATGTVAALDQLAKQFGVDYEVPEQPEDPSHYIVGHRSTIYLINPDGKVQAAFEPPFIPTRIARDFETIRTHFESLVTSG